MNHSESNRLVKNFVLPTKFWLPTFATMQIINPKVGTAPKNREVFMDNQSSPHFLP